MENSMCLFRRGFMRWLRAFVEIAEALVVIISFTAIQPNWSFYIICWETKHNLSDSIRERNVAKIMS